MTCEDCGGPCYDNRKNKKTPNSPDFRCKDRDCGWAHWLTEKGDPSRKAGFKKAKASPGGESARDKYWADKEEQDRANFNVYRREHAQEIAVAYVAGMAPGVQRPDLAGFKALVLAFEEQALSALKAKATSSPVQEDDDDLEKAEPPSEDGEDLDL